MSSLLETSGHSQEFVVAKQIRKYVFLRIKTQDLNVHVPSSADISAMLRDTCEYIADDILLAIQFQILYYIFHNKNDLK
jgi:hypothetical protein